MKRELKKEIKKFNQTIEKLFEPAKTNRVIQRRRDFLITERNRLENILACLQPSECECANCGESYWVEPHEPTESYKNFGYCTKGCEIEAGQSGWVTNEYEDDGTY